MLLKIVLYLIPKSLLVHVDSFLQTYDIPYSKTTQENDKKHLLGVHSTPKAALHIHHHFPRV